MLKHGRAGVPMEVMGLMLGEFVDDYTVRVIDVFAMPQSGTVSETFLSKLLLYFKRCHVTFEFLYVTASSSVFHTPHRVHLCSYSDSGCLFC